MSDMSAISFPVSGASDFALNLLTVLLIFGPAYLANTGAMLFGKWLPEKLGFGNHKIDGGRVHSDGNRLLGDGKSWEGLFGGATLSGLLMVLAHALWKGQGMASDRPFIDPILTADSSDWFWVGGEWGAAFVVGFTLGFACMLGDTAGSYVKRRSGMRREGEVSSKAPLLDTLPFAVFIFAAAGILYSGEAMMHADLRTAILGIIVLTPVIHRSFNILGYKLGLKSVPY